MISKMTPPAVNRRLDAKACMYGLVSSKQDFVLNYVKSGSRPLFLSATSESDVMRLVVMPDGSWRRRSWRVRPGIRGW